MKNATLTDTAIEALIRKEHTNPVTLKTYLSRLKRIRELLGAPTLWSILTDASGAFQRRLDGRLRSGKLTVLTVANLVSTLLTAYRAVETQNRCLPDAKAVWAAYHLQLRRREDAAYKQNRPINERQVANYVSMQEIQDALDARTSTTAVKTGAPELRDDMITLLLAFYVHLTPKRSDLGALRVFRLRRGQGVRPPSKGDINFVVWDASPSSNDMRTPGLLVLRRHKTSTEIVEELPTALVRLLEASLIRHPRDYVFVDSRDPERPLSNNAFTQFVRRTFAALFDGRAAGTSLLRHVYVTEKIDFNHMSLEERERIAKLMGHSVNMQTLVYKWVRKPTAKQAQRRLAQQPPTKKYGHLLRSPMQV